MKRQIAVRLPEDIVAFIDKTVAEGHGRSRAGVLVDLLERERRRRRAAEDVAILIATASDPDLDSLARYAARLPIDDLD